VQRRRANERELAADNPDDNVEAAELADGGVDEPLHVRLNIADQCDPSDSGGRFLGTLSIPVSNGQTTPGATERARDRASDPAATAADAERALAAKLAQRAQRAPR
jgi:hypothetical protein